MKNLLLFICLFVTFCGFGQNNTFPVSGNVGIGTTSPFTTLHVTGGTPMTAGWNKTFTLQATYPVQIFNSNSIKWAGIGYDFSTAMRFWVNASSDDVAGTGLPALNILNNGNIGIGTTAPTTKLDVNGDVNIAANNYYKIGGILAMYKSSHYQLLSDKEGRNAIYLGGTGDPNNYYDNGGHWLRNRDGSINFLSIVPSGNVGIGTTSPAYKLTINGTLYSNKATFVGQNPGANYTDGSIEIREVNTVGTAQTSDSYSPRITFHWGYVASKSIALGNNGNFKFNNQNDINSFANIEVGDIISNGNISLKGTLASRYYSVPFNGGINLSKNADTTAHLNFYDSPNNRVTAIRRLLSGEGNNGLGIYGFSNNNWTSILSLKDEGNIGIGTINPLSKLSVMGGVSVNNNNNAYGLLELFQNSADDGGDRSYLSLHRGGQIDWQLGLQGNNFVIASGGGAARTNLWEAKYFSINANGNVGIGTTSPTAKLDINGRTQFRDGIDFGVGGTSNVGMISWSGTNTFIMAANGTNPIGFNTGGSERMKIPSTGQVIIGSITTIPPDYKLAVAGNVIAEKVKVKKQSSGWPDYVFAPSYKLPSLIEVEKFVKQNSHLPEIPSAAEIEKDGQDLGDMNRLLLKKVEELTLYIINQEKRIQELEKKSKN